MADWQLDSGLPDYDPDKIYTASKDQQGHSHTLRINIPDYLVARLAELVQSKAIPAYRTKEDFVRDAIVHRLAWIQDQLEHGRLAERFEQTRQLLMATEEAEAYLAINAQYESALETIDKVGRTDSRQQDWDHLKEFLLSQTALLPSMPPFFQQQGDSMCRRYWQMIPLNVTKGQAWHL